MTEGEKMEGGGGGGGRGGEESTIGNSSNIKSVGSVKISANRVGHF